MMMDEKIKRSEEQIDEQIRIGKEWTDKYPFSAFGDNNKADYELHKRILEMAKAGKRVLVIESYIDDLPDEEIHVGDDALTWLRFGNEDDIYSEDY